jgi:hypothetical protein
LSTEHRRIIRDAGIAAAASLFAFIRSIDLGWYGAAWIAYLILCLAVLIIAVTVAMALAR